MPRTSLLLRAVLLALMALVVAASSACVVNHERAGADHNGSGEARAGSARTVAFLGDSITVEASDQLKAEGVKDGWSVAIDATVGVMAYEREDNAKAIARSRPRVVVVNLGTNDEVCALYNIMKVEACRYPDYTAADIAASLRRIATDLNIDATCVVGVNPYLGDESAKAWQAMVSEGIVGGIADWKGEAKAHHDEYLTDEIGHLTPLGQQRYAELMYRDMARICPAP